MPEHNLKSVLHCSVDDLVDLKEIGHSAVHRYVKQTTALRNST
jgi:hypothetical protein